MPVMTLAVSFARCVVPTGWSNFDVKIEEGHKRMTQTDQETTKAAGQDAAGSSRDFVVSADGHVLEPTDLFKTRLPMHLRERAVWEEDFEIEPFVDGGARIFR